MTIDGIWNKYCTMKSWTVSHKQNGILIKTVWDPKSETAMDTRWDPKHIAYHEKPNQQQTPQCWTKAWNGTPQC